MLGFGSLTQMVAPVQYDAQHNFSCEFDLPNATQLLVIGIATVGSSAAAGNSLIVTDLSHRKTNRILGENVGNVNSSGVPIGVPLRHIAAMGNQDFPWWPGHEAHLRRLVEKAFPLTQAKYLPYLNPDQAIEQMRTVRNGNLDIAGFVVSQEKLKISGVDISAAHTDRPTAMVFYALVLGQRFDIRLVEWAENAPWWLAHDVAEQAAALGAESSVTQEITIPSAKIGDRQKGAAMIHLQTRATIYDNTNLEPQPELHLVNAGNQDPSGVLSQFIGDESRLSAFAGSSNVPLFARSVWDTYDMRWTLTNAGSLGDAAQIYMTDYLWTRAEDD